MKQKPVTTNKTANLFNWSAQVTMKAAVPGGETRHTDFSLFIIYYFIFIYNTMSIEYSIVLCTSLFILY